VFSSQEHTTLLLARVQLFTDRWILKQHCGLCRKPIDKCGEKRKQNHQSCIHVTAVWPGKHGPQQAGKRTHGCSYLSRSRRRLITNPILGNTNKQPGYDRMQPAGRSIGVLNSSIASHAWNNARQWHAMASLFFSLRSPMQA